MACRPPTHPSLGLCPFSFFLQDPARAGGDPVLLLPPSLGVSVLFINTFDKNVREGHLLTRGHSENTVNRATPLHIAVFTPDVELHSRSSRAQVLSTALSSALCISTALHRLQCSTALHSTSSHPPSPLSWTPGPGAGPLHLPTTTSCARARHKKAAAARAAAASEERGSTTYRERERTKRASRRVQVRCK